MKILVRSGGAAAVLLGALLLSALPAAAYIGPGAGLTAVGVFVAFIFAILVGIFGFFWYPIKRLLKSRKKRQPEHDTAPADAADE